MTLTDFFGAIAQVAGLLFVVTSMLAMGLSLTIPQIIQPLKNLRLVVLALLANFVLVPLLANIILRDCPELLGHEHTVVRAGRRDPAAAHLAANRQALKGAPPASAVQ